jgi:hypothetical protein
MENLNQCNRMLKFNTQLYTIKLLSGNMKQFISAVSITLLPTLFNVQHSVRDAYLKNYNKTHP